MESSPFSKSSLVRRSPPPTPTKRPPIQQPDEDTMEVVSTPEIQNWMSSIEQCLNEVCTIATEGKLNSEQKLKIHNLCRKVAHGSSQLAVKYQSLKMHALRTQSTMTALQEKADLAECLSDMKQKIEESAMHKQDSRPVSFADMVKKGTNNFLRPNQLSSVAIYPKDKLQSSDVTRDQLQKVICPEKMKLQVRGVRKTRNGGVVISTETKEDIEKLKQSVLLSTSALSVDEPHRRKPRITIIGVPVSLKEEEVLKCLYEQNLADKLPDLTCDAFLSSVKISHKSGKRDAPSCNYIIEVTAHIRRVLIKQERLFVNWTSCPVRDFTLVTRCYKCQQYGHAAKSCRESAPMCGHCGEVSHTINECTKKETAPKCATCLRFKKPHNHKTGDPECPAKKNAEFRYINSIDYVGA